MQPFAAPLIGIVADHKPIRTTDRSHSARTFTGAYASYIHALTLAGALPVIVPLQIPPDTLRGVFDRLDGVLLPGGGDLDPATYGEADPAHASHAINRQRDRVELTLSRWAAEEDVPLLGICRGHQVVNVALGGTLYVDIPTQLNTEIPHDTHMVHPPAYLAHTVQIEADSRLAEIMGNSTLHTNSRHHQAVRQPGVGLRITAHAPDGIIEATELPTNHFFITVQWHPENLVDHDPAILALFQGLVQAAGQLHRQPSRQD